MTSNFSDFDPDSIRTDSEFESMESDRFELLSAYIDGELSSIEILQVQTWLDQDPEIKNIYIKLLGLQKQIQHSVVPSDQKSVEEITEGVFQTIDIEHSRRKRKLVFSTAAIATLIFAAVMNPFGGESSLQFADTDNPNTISQTTMLAVAVNKPAINIPKTAISSHADLVSP